MKKMKTAAEVTRHLKAHLRGLNVSDMAFDVKSEDSGSMIYPNVGMIGQSPAVVRSIFDELKRLKDDGTIIGFDLTVDHKLVKTRP